MSLSNRRYCFGWVTLPGVPHSLICAATNGGNQWKFFFFDYLIIMRPLTVYLAFVIYMLVMEHPIVMYISHRYSSFYEIKQLKKLF